MWVIQVVGECKSPEEAANVLAALRLQDGCLGGRVIGDGNRKPHAAQAFFETNGEYPNGALPDGVRHVLLPPSLAAAVGVTSFSSPSR